MFNDRNQMIEQFMFTQVDVSGNIARQPIKSRLRANERLGTRTNRARAAQNVDAMFPIREHSAGFRCNGNVEKPLVRPACARSHLCFSDGVSMYRCLWSPVRASKIQGRDGGV